MSCFWWLSGFYCACKRFEWEAAFPRCFLEREVIAAHRWFISVSSLSALFLAPFPRCSYVLLRVLRFPCSPSLASWTFSKTCTHPAVFKCHLVLFFRVMPQLYYVTFSDMLSSYFSCSFQTRTCGTNMAQIRTKLTSEHNLLRLIGLMWSNKEERIRFLNCVSLVGA